MMKYGMRYSTPSGQPVRGESQMAATSTADTRMRMKLVFCFFVTAFTPPYCVCKSNGLLSVKIA